jgi:glycosyltransferase involved in cell wall biosynthesis
MHLIYLIAGTFNAGGMERVMTGKANWLVRHGYEVSVITTDQRDRKPYFPLDDRIRTYDLGINYDADNGRLLSKIIHYPIRQWKHKHRLSALLMKLQPDVVICMFNNDVSFAYKIHDGSHKVLEVHFSKNKKLQYGRRGLWALIDKWRTWQEERIVQKYDSFVVLTKEDKKLWGNLPNIQVIPNALTFKPTQRAALTHNRVLAVGRLDWQKGFDRLIDIWERVQGCKGARVQEWHLDIVGSGPLHDELQKQIDRQGLHESVRLLPPTSDIQSLYLSSSIFVLSSRYEGLPMVLLEAQAFGLPIVSFACQCGPRDIIHDGDDGFLIEDRNEELFAQRLCELMQDFTLRQRMGASAVTASNAFTGDQIMASWDKLFNSCFRS